MPTPPPLALEEKMSALFKRKFKAPPLTDSPTTTVRVVSSESAHNSPVRILPPEGESSSPLIRWVKIGDNIYGVKPDECHQHILSNGTPYYPYYDDTLATVDINDYDNDYNDLTRNSL